jgi:hypothetical protein
MAALNSYKDPKLLFAQKGLLRFEKYFSFHLKTLLSWINGNLNVQILKPGKELSLRLD